MTLRDIAAAIEDWAPPATAQSYDNVGLQIGRPDRQVSRVLVALDVTSAVVSEAIAGAFELVVTHHPLLFKPLNSLTPGSPTGRMALRLAEEKIALYTAHTNLDAARGGVSFALAERLGLVDVDFLAPLEGHVLKLVTYVPSTHADALREALANASTGKIGGYEACAFSSEGTGYFRPPPDGKPFVGKVSGEVQSAAEVRIEVEVADWRLHAAVAALTSAHPYEEVAYDVYQVRQPYRSAGLGAIGNLTEPVPQDVFITRVADSLNAHGIRYSGPEEGLISRVAVCGGSGADLLEAAQTRGAEALVTADIKYHRFFDAFDEVGRGTMLLVDAGHYETEQMTEDLLAEFLVNTFPDLHVQTTRNRTGPVRYFGRS